MMSRKNNDSRTVHMNKVCRRKDKNEEIKKKNAAVVFRALAAIPERDNDIKGIIDGLTIDAQDTLMKYIYRALGEAQSCGSMLKWHGALLEKAGIGAIVRTMVDRKTV